VASQGAEGELPVPGVYGVPEQWPHIRALYERAGFAHTGHTEVVYLATVGDLPHLAGPPLAGLSVRRSVGISGTRLSAVLGEEVIGYIEIEVLEEGERLSRHGGWADVGNLHGKAAGVQDVRLGGGPTMIRDFLAAGLVDHMHIVVVPILLGRGVRVWDGLEGLEKNYDVETLSSPSGVTHVTFSRAAA
jgi:hypothetical protein